MARVVLARALDEAQASRARLAALGHATTLAPVTEIVWPPIGPLPDADFTLASSPRAFVGFQSRPEAERAGLLGKPVFVVGPRSARAAQAAGFRDVREAPAGDAASLIGLLAGQGARGRALYLAGRDRKPALEAALPDLGITAKVIEAYHAGERRWSAGERDGVAQAAREGGWALHYSRRSAELFLDNLRVCGLDAGALRHAAISPDAAAPIREAGGRARAAARPTETEMFALLTS